MKLEWKDSKTIKGWTAQVPDGNFYRVEQLGPRTFILRVNSQFIERYRTEVGAKEYAERMEDAK